MSDTDIVPKRQIDELVRDVVKAGKATGGTGRKRVRGSGAGFYICDIHGGNHVGIMEELGRKYRIETDGDMSGIQFGDGWWATLEHNPYGNYHTLFVSTRFLRASGMNRMPLPYMCEDEIVGQLDWYEPRAGYDMIGVNAIMPTSFCPKHQARVDFFNGNRQAQTLWFQSPSFFDEDNRRDMADIVRAYAESKGKGFVEGCVGEWKF